VKLTLHAWEKLKKTREKLKEKRKKRIYSPSSCLWKLITTCAAAAAALYKPNKMSFTISVRKKARQKN
jgi:hypothetical protein